MNSLPKHEVRVFLRHKNESVLNYDLFAKAWDECEELRQQPRDVWAGRALYALSSMDRHELAVLHSGVTIAGCVVAPEWDAHVGECTTVFTQYVLPEFRHQGISSLFIRTAMRLARTYGSKTLAYTHRKGPWRYETIYRKVL